MREFLTRISPVTNAAEDQARRSSSSHGRNDPRVPLHRSRADRRRARKNGAPVWYLLADNEGHGFARKANADFLFYAMSLFFQERLLKQ